MILTILEQKWPRNFKMLLAQIARAHSIRLIEEITQSKFQLSSSKTEFFTAVWSFDFFQTIFYSLHAFIRITARTRTPAYLEELRRNSFFLWFWWKIQIWNPYVTRISNSAGDFGFVFFKKLRFSSAAAGPINLWHILRLFCLF